MKNSKIQEKNIKKAINYISQDGYDKLASEYNQLRNVERPKILELISWAASNGDRSENADYQYGRKRLREIDARLRKLGRKIEDAQIVEFLTLTGPLIRFGATVRIINNESNEIRTITIVGSDEISPDQGMVSWKSPIGKALLGKEEGDEITIQTPSSNESWTIDHVTYIDWPSNNS